MIGGWLLFWKELLILRKFFERQEGKNEEGNGTWSDFFDGFLSFG